MATGTPVPFDSEVHKPQVWNAETKRPEIVDPETMNLGGGGGDADLTEITERVEAVETGVAAAAGVAAGAASAASAAAAAASAAQSTADTANATASAAAPKPIFDTAARFTSGDAFTELSPPQTTLLAGQEGYETDTDKSKVSPDGTTAWGDLDYREIGEGGGGDDAVAQMNTEVGNPVTEKIVQTTGSGGFKSTSAGAMLFANAAEVLSEAALPVGVSTLHAMDLDKAGTPQFAAIELGHASDTTITRVSAGVIAVEGVNVLLSGASSPEFTTIQLGHASDTTLARVSAGVMSVEGATVLVSGGALGTPASGVATNITGLVAANLLGGTLAAGVGYKETVGADGTKSSGTYTPDATTGNIRTATNGGAHTLGVPTGTGTVIVHYTNNGSAGAITTSGFTKVVGSFTTTNGHKFYCTIVTIAGGDSLLNIVAMQ